MTITAGPVGTDEDAQASYDRYARMTQRALRVPVALVSLVEEHHQRFAGLAGLKQPWATTRESPLSHSFCQHVVADRRPLVITDARNDPRLRDNLAIEDLDVVAYAGWPLTDHEGTVVGSLCAIDSAPRRWTDHELEALADLAATCSVELAQRGMGLVSQRETDRVRRLSQRSGALLTLSARLGAASSLSDVVSALDEVGTHQLGCARAGIWLRDDLHRSVGDCPVERAEKLTRVESTVPWPQAESYRVLAAGCENPVGLAFVQRESLYFTDRAAQDDRFGATHTSTSSGEARAMLPLGLSGQWYGVLVLTWSESWDFDHDLRATIDAMGAYTSQAVARAVLMQERLEVSSTLQAAMLTALPEPPGLTLGARYRPASRREMVGGDWYDAVQVDAGATVVMIGDVVGHDIHAAAVMGQLRNMLRAFAWALDESPARSVARLDRALPTLAPGAMATVAMVRITADREGWAARWSSAGHPPCLIVDPSGSTSWCGEVSARGEAGSGSDVMLGVEATLSRSDHDVVVAPGSTLLLFTDGLVERRGEDLQTGLDRVRRLAATHATGTLDDLLDAVLALAPAEGLLDDVAVLGVRFGDPQAR